MFYDCTSLEKIDLSSFDTSRVTNMHAMFYDCVSLKSLDLSNFNASQVTDVENLLYNAGITAQEAGFTQ